jgi:hypothetical protein
MKPFWEWLGWKLGVSNYATPIFDGASKDEIDELRFEEGWFTRLVSYVFI